ncbi:MAG: extracellular solute-binding protein [Lentisphaerae bacterium]|nr:extracellular solute-binding protein [Lentisphaerota bacterium]
MPRLQRYAQHCGQVATRFAWFDVCLFFFPMNRAYIPTLLLFLALLLVLLAPFLLQGKRAKLSAGARALVIISPHNEAVRYEFERAFRRWHQARFGEAIAIDWRNIGGTSEIVRYLDGEFAAAERTGRRGIGLDLFFGGGAYDHAQQARKGHLEACGVRKRHPDWLTEAIIPATFSGEVFYDTQDRWYGCCLSSFGICWNQDVLAAHGISRAPRSWADLANFKFFGLVALADPTKSGSINKAFEMLIQEQLRAELTARGVPAGQATPEALAAGWSRALGLIRQIGANARYFTDSASKVPLDVAQGNAAAGMCIDFYGRFESEMITRNEGSARMNYLTPAGGSSISVDPISLVRGAPHRELAERFIDFCLSPEGQQLWNSRVGAPGGPERYALRRLPIRKDMYTAAFLATMSDPAVAPYEQGGGFTYQAAWTAPVFSLIRTLIRTMCIDTHAELRQAWEAINRNGAPAECPDAFAAFMAVPPNAEYGQALAVTAGQLNDKLTEARLTREWILFFRDQYRQARELAEL